MLSVPRPRSPAPIAVTRLANGVRVVSRTLPGARSVALGIWIAHGSRHEAAHENGYTHLWEHLWFRTLADDGARRIDRMGGQVNAYTTRELCALHGRVLPQHLPSLLALFAEMIAASTFADADVLRERDAVLAEIAAAADSPDADLEDAGMQRAWGDHPLARPVLGIPSVLEAIRAQDMQAFAQRALAGANVYVVGAGALTHAQLLQQSSALARLPAGMPIATTPPVFHPGAYTKRGGVARSRLLWLLPLPARSDAGYATALLAHRLLAGGLDSRLFRALRGERALAYDIHSRLEPYSDSGLWVIRVNCAAEKERECQNAVEECLHRFAVDGPTPEELPVAFQSLHAEFSLNDDDVEASAEQLAQDMIYEGRTLTLEERLQDIDTVSAPAIMALTADAVRRMLRLTWSP